MKNRAEYNDIGEVCTLINFHQKHLLLKGDSFKINQKDKDQPPFRTLQHLVFECIPHFESIKFNVQLVESYLLRNYPQLGFKIHILSYV